MGTPACTIIGWDDTIPASLFSGGASPGRRLVGENSTAPCPISICPTTTTAATYLPLITPQKEEYDFNYFYDSSVDDFGMAASLNYTCAANVFQGLKGSDSQTEYVKAVQVFMAAALPVM